MTDWIQGRVAAKTQWSEQLFSLQIEVPSYTFKAGQYVKIALDIDGKRIGRPYSLVNAPEERRLEVSLPEVQEGPGYQTWWKATHCGCPARRAACSLWIMSCSANSFGYWLPGPLLASIFRF